ncbi:MAG: hypothetical protein AB7S65_02415 [Sulfuricurvum sp.]
MKKQLLILIVAIATPIIGWTDTVLPAPAIQSQGDKELAWVDEQIAAILPSRIGVNENYVNGLKDPMKYKKHTVASFNGLFSSRLLPPPQLGSSNAVSLQPPKIVEEPLRLQAVMNQSAMINKKWYHVNEAVRSYSLAEIRGNSVLLKDIKGQPMVLFLSKPSNNIQIITK